MPITGANRKARRYAHCHSNGDAADNVATQAVYNATSGTTNSTAYTYNAGNELTQAVSSANGTTAYTYDSWGRLATITRGAQSATLGWAYQDRLKSYTTTLTGERSQNFSHTGDGRRNALDNALLGAKTWSYYQNWGVRTQSYTSYPDYSAWYILEPGGTLLASAPASGVATTLKYYVKDHLGSTRSVRRENTTRSVGFEYDPYGGLYASSGVTGFTQDRFTGHEFDIETNLYWAPYRYYRPDMLRWISRDPLGMVDEMNLYGYTPKPLLFANPSGGGSGWANLISGLGGPGIGALAGCGTSMGYSIYLSVLSSRSVGDGFGDAICSCLGGGISGAVGSVTGILGGTIGGAIGGTSTCMCNKARKKGLNAFTDTDNWKCCASSGTGGALGGLLYGGLGTRYPEPYKRGLAHGLGQAVGGNLGNLIGESTSSCCD